MKIYILCFLLLITGCNQTMQIVVSKEEIPILIEKDGCFVTKRNFIKLINGSSVEYTNKYIDKYYLPSNLIIINDNKVKLKSIE